MSDRRPLARRRQIAVVVVLITGLGLMAAPFVIHVGGVLAGVAALVGFAAVLGSYLVLWRDAVVRVETRLLSTTLSRSTQEWVVVVAYLVISVATLAILLGLVAIGGGG